MRVAVTGASGFLGGAVARDLAAKGHTVFSFGRRHADAIRHPLPNYSQWDLLAGSTAVPDVDAVIHCAAKVGDWGPAADYRRINVDGTRLAMQTFDQAERFVHVSSASVYSGNQPGQQISEDASVGNCLHTAYAISKAEAEKLVLAGERRAVILRPHIVYGPGDTTLTPRLLAAPRFGWLPVPGNGRNFISVTHVFNFVHAVERVLDSRVMHGIFNIADRQPVSVDNLIRTLLQRNNVAARLIYIPRPIAWAAAMASERVWRIAGRRSAPRLTRYLVAHISDEFMLDLTKAYEQLGYAPSHGFHDAPIRVEDR